MPVPTNSVISSHHSHAGQNGVILERAGALVPAPVGQGRRCCSRHRRGRAAPPASSRSRLPTRAAASHCRTLKNSRRAMTQVTEPRSRLGITISCSAIVCVRAACVRAASGRTSYSSAPLGRSAHGLKGGGALRWNRSSSVRLIQVRNCKLLTMSYARVGPVRKVGVGVASMITVAWQNVGCAAAGQSNPQGGAVGRFQARPGRNQGRAAPQRDDAAARRPNSRRPSDNRWERSRQSVERLLRFLRAAKDRWQVTSSRSTVWKGTVKGCSQKGS